MKLKGLFGLAVFAIVLSSPAFGAADLKRGSVVTEFIDSAILQENLVGLDPRRAVKIYLPPGYAASEQPYPVLYFCHSINWSAEKVFEDGNIARMLDRAFANGVTREFIVVAADYATAMMGSLYENSPVSGRWLDFTVQELVPFIDRNFRTLRQRESRALTGDFMGGRGVLKLAMTHSNVFSIAYALHPVATGAGSMPYPYIPIDWRKIHAAKTYRELSGPGREQIFVLISQAFLPNLQRPPFYCDFSTEMENGEPKFSPENTRRLQKGFHLDEGLDEAAANLRGLRALALDWARHDPTETHVKSAQIFTRKLIDLGVAHEAEEYLGNPWDKNWTEHGRFYTRVLPFLGRYLVFSSDSGSQP